MSKTPGKASTSQTIPKSRTKSNKGNQPKSQPVETTSPVKAASLPPAISLGVALSSAGENWGAVEDGESWEIQPPLPLKRLPENVKCFIVCQNACGSSPSEVVKAVKATFDIEVTSQRVEKYDPTKAAGATLGVEMKSLFRAMQREFQTMVIKAGAADQKWRLAKLHIIAQTAFDRGNYKLSMEAMEQIAKEVGGVYTNKSQIQIDDKRELLARLLKCNPHDLPAMKALVDEAKTKEKVH